ncbi:MAG: HAD family hydrolase [Planctomycetota bacterium]
MTIEALLLDVGNTLLYLDYERLLRVLAPLLPAGTTAEQAARAERRARPRLSEYLHANKASTEDPRSFQLYVELALDELGVKAEARALEATFAELCREHRAENFFSQRPPGVLEALAELAPRMKLAVVSNAGGRVKEKLAATGFGAHLLAVVDSGIEGVEKPDPRIFLAGCERAGVAPERALYVGDLHAIDVVGARAAGLKPLLLDPAGAYRERGVRDVPLVPSVTHVVEALLGRGSAQALW